MLISRRAHTALTTSAPNVINDHCKGQYLEANILPRRRNTYVIETKFHFHFPTRMYCSTRPDRVTATAEDEQSKIATRTHSVRRCRPLTRAACWAHFPTFSAQDHPLLDLIKITGVLPHKTNLQKRELQQKKASTV